MVVADDAVPTQLIALILLTNWCYTNMARQQMIFVHYAKYYGLTVYKNIKIG